MEWSGYQRAVFEAVEKSDRNLVVSALAGSGKTATTVECLNVLRRVRPDARVLFCAFNKRIQEELARRAPAGVDVLTCHSLGYRMVREAWGGTRVNGRREGDLVFAAGKQMGRVLKGEERKAALKLASWCKNTLEECDGNALFRSRASLQANGDAEYVVALAKRVLDDSTRRAPEISFDDMVYLPNAIDLRTAAYDVILVDETQDLNKAQIEMLFRAGAKDCRVIAVGDSRQALYGFRGAAPDAMDNLVRRLDAEVLPLSVCYRCPTSVIAAAQEYVPEIESAPGAGEGVVRVASDVAMKQEAAPGDFVLSRTNAPLLPLCLAALRRGVPAMIAGRDVGDQIKGRIEKAVEKVGADLAEVAKWLRGWAVEQIRRLGDDPEEADVEAIEDVRDTCLGLLADCETVGEVNAKCDRLFGDVEGGDEAARRARLVFSTVHRAKGLEADRVWVLASTLRPDRGQEEKNIAYVAVTRARRELVMVS